MYPSSITLTNVSGFFFSSTGLLFFFLSLCSITWSLSQGKNEGPVMFLSYLGDICNIAARTWISFLQRYDNEWIPMWLHMVLSSWTNRQHWAGEVSFNEKGEKVVMGLRRNWRIGMEVDLIKTYSDINLNNTNKTHKHYKNFKQIRWQMTVAIFLNLNLVALKWLLRPNYLYWNTSR